MNIFAVDEHPIRAAHQMVDKHVVKMILEAGQMLSTSHRVLDGGEYYDKTNMGGGGGGAGSSSPSEDWAGGSGIVIIRYKFQ